MIVVKLAGGLGNQMFQYAAGQSLSARLGSPLYLDTNWFDEVKTSKEVVQREYGLSIFDIYPKKMSIPDNLRLKLRPLEYIKEDLGSYNKEFETLMGNLFLDGYWQNEKYFKKQEQRVSKAFTFKAFSSTEKQEIASNIKSSKNPVSISIRRGDYVTRKVPKEVLGSLPLTYYYEAVEMVGKKLSNPCFFVMSDDSEWCKKNFKIKFPVTYVDNTPGNDGDDMHLVSLCNCHIIANSTFGWWGAWLNKKADKIVIGPKRWYADHSFAINPMPDTWIKI